uniref:Uncharacterized protein n=1 Tax=Tanacetum cinerariifolium TaxID=118510 RepID=A0A6L2JPI6_TANCI|nr:hypothetical protein [Tanacetum cinerariifolium]
MKTQVGDQDACKLLGCLLDNVMEEDASKQERSIKDIDQDAKIALVDESQGRIHDADLFGVDDLEVTAVSVEDSVAPTTTTTANVDDELNLAKTLIAIKAAQPKVILTATITPRAKDQITLDEEVARKLEAEMRAEIEEEERIARKKDKANRAVIEEWDDVQATVDADGEYFAAKRAEEIRNKPPTKAKHKSLMCTYMRNMEGFKQKDFKGKSFNDIKKMFDKVYNRVNTFVDMDTENVEESLKKTQAKGKIVLEDDDDVAIEATPLSSKSPTIVDYKIYREGTKSYFKIIRADGNSPNYLTFRTMFKNFNREDLEVLRSIVKERLKKTKPVDDMENLFFQTLKTMFKPHVKDIIWKYQ